MDHEREHVAAPGVSYPTAKGDIDQLVDLKILTQLEGVYPKTFVAMAIYEVAFHEPDHGAPSAEQ